MKELKVQLLSHSALPINASVESGEGIERSPHVGPRRRCGDVESGEGIERRTLLSPDRRLWLWVESGEGIESFQHERRVEEVDGWNPVKELKGRSSRARADVRVVWNPVKELKEHPEPEMDFPLPRRGIR